MSDGDRDAKFQGIADAAISRQNAEDAAGRAEHQARVQRQHDQEDIARGRARQVPAAPAARAIPKPERR